MEPAGEFSRTGLAPGPLTITILDINGDNDYGDSMAVLNIRNRLHSVHQALRLRTAKSGRSLEAEVRAILTEMFSPAAPPVLEFQEWVDHLYGDNKPHDVVGELHNERRLDDFFPVRTRQSA